MITQDLQFETNLKDFHRTFVHVHWILSPSNKIQVSKFPAYDVPLTLAQVNGGVPGFMAVKQAVSTGSQGSWANLRKQMQ